MSSTSTTVVVGVCGGIAAYKSAELIRSLKSLNFDVHVIPTLNALRFIGEATLSALSGNKVMTDVWQEAQDVQHINLAKTADAIAVYPTTADFMARLVEGRSNDLLSATLLSSSAPKILFPAMHTEMWLNPATQENVRILRERGYLILNPEEGKLTSGDSGLGRLCDPLAATAVISHATTRKDPFDLTGVKILITAGGTRESIDPVRFLSNKSSGKQGFALATAASVRGADVTLISANTTLTVPAGVTFKSVETSSEMLEAVKVERESHDIVIMAAAISDFTPNEVSVEKIKKTQTPELHLFLKPTEDILQLLTATATKGQTIVGFAAETGTNALERGLEKLLKKGCQVAVVNDVSEGRVFGEETNQVLIGTASGSKETSERLTKIQIAHLILDTISQYRLSGK